MFLKSKDELSDDGGDKGREECEEQGLGEIGRLLSVSVNIGLL